MMSSDSSGRALPSSDGEVNKRLERHDDMESSCRTVLQGMFGRYLNKKMYTRCKEPDVEVEFRQAGSMVYV